MECEPDITRRCLTPDDKFVLIASDGLWDVLSDQEAVDVADAELMVSRDFLARDRGIYSILLSASGSRQYFSLSNGLVN